MSDLISREDAIDALQKEINKGIPPFDDVIGSIRCGVRLARNIIEDLPPAQPKRMSNRKVSDRECPWCKAVCASTDKYCHECGWHIADTPQTESTGSPIGDYRDGVGAWQTEREGE